MLNTIGSPFTPTPVVSGKSSAPALGQSPGVLEAQLAQYQIQLADWTNCPSCNTPEGKAKIKEITDQISAIKKSLQAISANKPRQNSNPASSGATGATASPAPPLSSGPLGSQIDVFA